MPLRVAGSPRCHVKPPRFLDAAAALTALRCVAGEHITLV
jgi:hypothetical protein